MLDPLYLQQEEHSCKICYICNKMSTRKILYICIIRSTHVRSSISFAGWRDYMGLSIYFLYQCLFLVLPIQYISEHDLPPGSAVVCSTEQVRY